jgi:DNA-binding MarR family transcriptional regulator
MRITNFSIVHLMHRAAQNTDALFGEKAKGLTPRQFVVLDTLQKLGTASQTDLVRRTGIDRSTLADVIRRLIGKRLITRRRNRSDMRAYDVRLTELGRGLLNEVRVAAEEVDRMILDAVPEGQRNSFVSGLSTLAKSMETGTRVSPQA